MPKDDGERRMTAWARFKGKITALRKRQKEIVARFVKGTEEAELKKIRERMEDDHS